MCVCVCVRTRRRACTTVLIIAFVAGSSLRFQWMASPRDHPHTH